MPKPVKTIKYRKGCAVCSVLILNDHEALIEGAEGSLIEFSDNAEKSADKIAAANNNEHAILLR